MEHSATNPAPQAVSSTSAPERMLLLLLLLLVPTLLATAVGGAVGNTLLLPLEACIDFASGQYPESPWTLSECLEVWADYADTIPVGQQPRVPLVDTWRETATQLKSAGSPCLAASNPGTDGVGSSTIRHLSAWIFAEEMGCDWVTPDWGKKHVDGGNGSVVYCHRAATTQEAAMPLTRTQMQEQQRCAVVDWLAYFQFGVPSVSSPREGTARVIQASCRACSLRG